MLRIKFRGSSKERKKGGRRLRDPLGRCSARDRNCHEANRRESQRRVTSSGGTVANSLTRSFLDWFHPRTYVLVTTVRSGFSQLLHRPSSHSLSPSRLSYSIVFQRSFSLSSTFLFFFIRFISCCRNVGHTRGCALVPLLRCFVTSFDTFSRSRVTIRATTMRPGFSISLSFSSVRGPGDLIPRGRRSFCPCGSVWSRRS